MEGFAKKVLFELSLEKWVGCSQVEDWGKGVEKKGHFREKGLQEQMLKQAMFIPLT